MKKNFIKTFVLAIACVCVTVMFAGCSKTAKLEIYTGNVELLNTSVELILDKNNMCTFTSENGALMLGGKYEQEGDNYTFRRLDGKEIATATLKDDVLTLDFYGTLISLNKSVKSLKADKINGAYKGYVNDGRPYELCLVIRPENKYFVIAEDGDIHSYGNYKLDGSLITLTENDETETYAFGTVDGDKIELNLDNDKIIFQIIK